MSRARTIVVGDVHGCLEELEALLGEVGPRDGDRLWAISSIAAPTPSA